MGTTATCWGKLVAVFKNRCCFALLVNNFTAVCSLQVLGRNLEGIVNAAMTLKGKMGDQFVSVEHLVLALADDTRFGEQLFKAEGLTKAKLDAAVKEVSIKVALLCCHSTPAVYPPFGPGSSFQSPATDSPLCHLATRLCGRHSDMGASLRCSATLLMLACSCT